MRLYLSSFRLGKHPELFTELVGRNNSVALVLDAGDAWGDEAHTRRAIEQTRELAAIGLDAVDLQLRQYCGRPDELRNELKNYGGVWVAGGNTFVLRRAMRESGFDSAITSMLAEDRIAYGGYSAGICVLAPSLKGIHLVDDPLEAEPTFNEEMWEGLGILSFLPVPHYQSDHPESELMKSVVTFMERDGLPFKTLRDGEAIYMDGASEEITGSG